jgi:hypothetical protein
MERVEGDLGAAILGVKETQAVTVAVATPVATDLTATAVTLPLCRELLAK